MKNLLCLAAIAGLTCGVAGDAFADAETGQGYFSVMGSYIDDDKDRDMEDAINGGQFSLGYAFNDRWNVEGMLGVAIPKSDTAGVPDQNHLSAGIDLQRVFQRSERFSPYIHFGFGYFSDEPSNSPKIEGTMVSGGAGFYLDLFSSNVALRGEWRTRFETASDPNMKDNLFSLGLHVPFGPATPKFVDSDGDGVGDGMDRCPNTPAGAAVDVYGCELDSDGDGVKDSQDQCPNTPAGTRVDAVGCPIDLDDDDDGVLNDRDDCPNTKPGVQVDVNGCEITEEIKLLGVNFETNSDRLLPGATEVLDEAAASLRKHPSITVEVAGHTDSDGAAEYNESLSERRAITVHDYLMARGIADERMSVRGYGESQPIADNTTATGKAENRRVVLRIIDR